jgi:hypothetical protein
LSPQQTSLRTLRGGRLVNMWSAIYLYGIGSTCSPSYLYPDADKREIELFDRPPNVMQGAEASRDHPTNKR